MNVGELRELLAGLPDDADITLGPGDATYWEVSDARRFEPTSEHPWCLVLYEGQEVTMDLDLHRRDGFGELDQSDLSSDFHQIYDDGMMP